MKNNFARFGLLIWFFLCLFTSPVNAFTPKGIYITQETMEDTKYITYLVNRAKKVGINTFVVDLELPSKRYQQNVALLKDNNIIYIARIIMFPGGGTPEQIASEAYREKKHRLVETALSYGAQQIQLDYIRFNSKQPASSEHAITIKKIIQTFKNRLASEKIPLQVDVFGITAYGEEKHIGQSIPLFASVIDAVCPMVYPSHYVPFSYHFERPYKTVYDSLISIKEQFDDKMPIKLYPFIELSNYHFPLSKEKKLKYIYAQIQAVQDAGADGWYAWSAKNYYDNLFTVLENYPVK
ncbi:MAG TPA: putative glycoside hydrolase [Gammaproteobacteria bacterium]|nr:putative glycoside hydrolase [Gammaproteobacteria bacterium]